jgi:hypothetical protein
VHRVDEGRADAALVYDGDEAVAWCDYGCPAELPNIYHHRKDHVPKPRSEPRRSWGHSVSAVARVLVTGMSGTGKTTVLNELRRRGHVTVDTDYDGWTLADGSWDEPRMARFLASTRVVVVSGTVEPLLRRGATLELDGRLATSELADRIEELIVPA